MAKRYSGNCTVDITLANGGGAMADGRVTYDAKVIVNGRTVWRSTMGALVPNATFQTADCPEAYDQMARSAIAFAEADSGTLSADVTPEWESIGFGERGNGPGYGVRVTDRIAVRRKKVAA